MKSAASRQNVLFFLLALVLLYAYGLRQHTFWMPHWKGDQNHYVILALKMDKLGFKDDYNLRGVKLGNQIISREPPIELIFSRLGNREEKGDILSLLKMAGQDYYDEPLHMRAPLFPYLLMWSHRRFAPNEAFYIVCGSNLGKKVLEFKPEVVFKKQFWVVVTPLFFNMAVIFLVFLMGCRIAGVRVGLVAAFLMAVNPVSLMLAYRVLAEDVVVFFLILSLIAYLSFCENKNKIGLLIAGLLAGLAIFLVVK